MKWLFAAGLLIIASGALADRTVYKNVGADGKVTYSDRRSDSADTQVRNWSPGLSGYAYDAAVLRTQSDRLYYHRLMTERHQPVPTVVYDPRAWSQQRGGAAGDPYGYSRWGGWDPNLPTSPAPSLERNYYYNGR